MAPGTASAYHRDMSEETLAQDRAALTAKRQIVMDWEAKRINMPAGDISKLQQEIRELEQALEGMPDA
jgi:hypothetical protein